MPRGSGLALAACYLAIFAVGENGTAIMTLLPSLSLDLHLDRATAQWVVNAYLLAAASLIILGGKLADGFGARRSSAAGIALFALASLIIALAPSGIIVVGARALQGVGAALAVAGTLAAVTETVPEAGRPGAIGAWTGFLMLGFSLGPLIGGTITHYAGWRVNFWLNLLVMIPAATALALRPDPSANGRSSIDWPGLVLLVAFMVMLILGLQALPHGVAWATVLPLALSVLALAALYRTETRKPEPLLDFGLFARRNFALGAMLAFLLMFIIITLLLYYNLFAQAPTGLGLSPIAAGLSLLPLCVALFCFARAAPRLGAALGLRPMMAGGALVLILGCAIARSGLAAAGSPALILGLVAIGAGIALPYASAPRVGLAALPSSHAGQGSGVINACSFLGGTIGVTSGGITYGLDGFAGVLLLLMVPAALAAVLALRLRIP
jgi:MFS family permease